MYLSLLSLNKSRAPPTTLEPIPKAAGIPVLNGHVPIPQRNSTFCLSKDFFWSSTDSFGLLGPITWRLRLKILLANCHQRLPVCVVGSLFSTLSEIANELKVSNFCTATFKYRFVNVVLSAMISKLDLPSLFPPIWVLSVFLIESNALDDFSAVLLNILINFWIAEGPPMFLTSSWLITYSSLCTTPANSSSELPEVDLPV